MPWRTVPFGYCIRDGKVAVEEGEAAKLKKAFENYIGGMSYRQTAESAGLGFTHARMKRMMQDRRCLGDETFPTGIMVKTRKISIKGASIRYASLFCFICSQTSRRFSFLVLTPI